MDQYGDWLWLSLFAAGGASSLFGWAMQNLAKQRREAIDDVLNQLLRILSKARESKSMDELMKLTLDADELIATAVKQTRRKTTSTATMSAIMLSVDAVRHSIEDRRRELIENSAEARVARRRASSAS